MRILNTCRIEFVSTIKSPLRKVKVGFSFVIVDCWVLLICLFAAPLKKIFDIRRGAIHSS